MALHTPAAPRYEKKHNWPRLETKSCPWLFRAIELYLVPQF